MGRRAERSSRRKPVGGAPYRSDAIGLRAVPPTNQCGPRQLSPTGEDSPEAHAWQRPAGVGPYCTLMSPGLERGRLLPYIRRGRGKRLLPEYFSLFTGYP